MHNILFLGEKLKDAMTSVASYLVNPDSTVLEKEKEVPVYEHAGLHMVLRKIIGYDQTLDKNSESKSNFDIVLNCLKLNK